MLKRVLKNFGVVLRGRGIAAVFSLAATGLMANALSAREFGLIILLHTYVLVVRGALNFRTFEAVVRFGIPLAESKAQNQLFSLLRSTALIDIAAALAALVIGMIAAPLAGHYLQWEGGMANWAIVYCMVILATANGTPNGILRIYNRFDALGVQFTVGPALRFILVVAAWLMDASMFAFLIAWGSAFAVGHVYMTLRGLLELRRQTGHGLWPGFRWGEVRDRDSEFWKFIGVVYWQTNIDLLPKHVSTLLAGGLLGPAAAGLFRLAREFSTVLTQPAVMLREVLFPDLTRSYHADGADFGKVPFRTALIAGTVGLAFAALSLVFGPALLGLIGDEYVVAAPLLSLLLLAASFDLSSASLRAAAYAMGKASTVLRIHILGITTYVAAFFALTPALGLAGPGYAAILGSLLALLLTGRLIFRQNP
jgi:O-antigen/teichoic acid export membrane protein